MELSAHLQTHLSSSVWTLADNRAQSWAVGPWREGQTAVDALREGQTALAKVFLPWGNTFPLQ